MSIHFSGGGGRGQVDKVTGAIETIDYSHHEVHDGGHYYMEGHTTLASGASLYVKLTTPDTTKWAHFTWNIQSSGILESYLYEDVEGGMAGGASVPPLNNNRNSSNTSGVVIVSGVGAANTISATISKFKVGSSVFKGTVGGESGRGDEIILKQNTVYLRKFLSGSADNVISFKASWYEHTNKG